MNADRVASTTLRTARRTPLRRPLATARPGLDYLRGAFLAGWEQGGVLEAGELAEAFLQAAAGTPQEHSDHAAVARWAVRLHARTPQRAATTC